jgi:plasmid maintenance system killer protein
MQPESKLMFKEFKDLQEEKMHGNKRLRGLALSIMYKLTEYIDRIDDPESLEDLMMNTSKAHHRRDVGPKQFKVNNIQDWVPLTFRTGFH